MVYKIVSVVCDEIEKGFSIGYAELQYQSNKWEHDNFLKSVYEYEPEWKQKLNSFYSLSAKDYLVCHDEFGYYIGEIAKKFIEVNKIDFKVQLIAFKGISFLDRYELGNPAQIAAVTGINTVSDINALNIAFDGNGNYEDSIANSILPNQPKELQLALLAILRWREENNFLAETTGAKRNSIGGSVWLGQEA